MYKIYPAFDNYPRAEKFALTQYIKINFFNLLASLALSQKVKSKRIMHAQEADGYLQTIKILIKLSRELRYISIGFFKEIDLELTEISKMLSAYIKAI